MGRFQKPRSGNLGRALRTSALVLAGMCVIWGSLLATHWPFARKAVMYSLERISSSEVQIARYHETFFPYPGYVAESVVIRRNSQSGSPPLVAIQTITCRASWSAVLSFTHRVKQMRLEGLRVFIPAHLPPPVRKDPSAKIQTTVTELVADGAVLEIASHQPGAKPLRFDFAKLTLNEVAKKKSIRLRTIVHTPYPPGDMSAIGAVGPFPSGNLRETPLSGSFSLTHADLSSFGAIKGTLSAKGSFSGKLGQVDVRGDTDVPDFEVTRSRHAVHLGVAFHGVVNGLNGNVVLQTADARLIRTVVVSEGRVTSEVGRPGKNVSLGLTANEGRIQDLMRIFVRSPQPPLDGSISFRAQVFFPAEIKSFLRKVRLEGDFGITGARFTNPLAQQKVAELSERSQKKGERDQSIEGILSNFKGHVVLRDGTATFSNSSFTVPGAVARLAGTYNLINEGIDLYGTLAMQASLSEAAGGIKSILLKPLNPFFRKKGAGTFLHVRILGTYSHPIFTVAPK